MSSAAAGEPIRFVLVSTAYPPTDDRQHAMMWRDVAAEFVRRGHEVTVVTTRDGGASVTVEDGGVRVIRRMRERGAATATRGRSSTLGARHDCRWLRKAVRKSRADVVVFADLMGATSALLGVPFPSGCAVLCDATTGWMEDLADGGGAWFRHWSARAPSFGARVVKGIGRLARSALLGVPMTAPELPLGPILTTEPGALASLAAVWSGLPRGRLIEPGIDLRRFKDVPRTTPTDGRRLLYTGPIDRDNGLHTAMLALGDLDKHVRLRIVGEMRDPDYMAEVAAMGRAAGVMDRVELRPQAGDEELPELLAGADALVITSHRAERFPRLALRSFAARTVVVGTPVGGRGDVLTDGETGFTFTTGNARELAQKLSRLLADRDLEQRIAAAAGQLVEERFAVGFTCGQIERLARGATSAARREDG